MKKRALITGITGMVGSHLADFLLENTDWDIYGMARWRSPLDNTEHLLERVNNKDRVYFIYGDLNDFGSLVHVIKESSPDYVFHLAAQSYPKTSFDSPADTLQTNIIGTNNLLEAIRLSELKPVIHVCASSEVFGRVPKELTPIHEDVPFHPASPYAISKVGTDLVGRFYAEAYGMTVMTTRMFTHTGPRRGDVFAESTFAKQIALIEEGVLLSPIVKVGNLDSMRTWADVRDAVRAYYMLATHNPIAGEYYNIGGTYSCTIKDMLSYLISLSTKKDEIKVEVEEVRLRPIDADLQIPDTKKFTDHSGWKPIIPFETTMQDLLNYWREKVKRGQKVLTR
ncbi:GDP-mannose 4,6-dehydratase [bacterium]